MRTTILWDTSGRLLLNADDWKNPHDCWSKILFYSTFEFSQFNDKHFAVETLSSNFLLKSEEIHYSCQRFLLCYQWYVSHIRSSHQRWSVKKVFLEMLQNSQESKCARVSVSFLIKLQAWGKKVLLKKRLWHKCFPVNFVKLLRTNFFIEHLWWLLLTCLIIVG